MDCYPEYYSHLPRKMASKEIDITMLFYFMQSGYMYSSTNSLVNLYVQQYANSCSCHNVIVYFSFFAHG